MLMRTGAGALALILAGGLATGATAADLSIVAGSVGNDLQILRQELDQFQDQTGHKVDIVSMPSSSTDQFAQYRLWLSAQNQDIDVYWTDVIWAPQLAEHFVDLKNALKEELGQHIPQIVESQMVDGKLIAVPMYTDAPALYYRKDLLEKHGKEPPKTWSELEQTAKEIMDAERADGSKEMYGFVFQGAAYEGLTCNALEWIASNGGGEIVSPEGEITVNNPQAAEILNKAAGWVGTIAPPGVLAYQEEDSRGVWQTGNAVFMRNWPYAYSLGMAEDSNVKGKFDVTTLPKGEASGDSSAAALGGWNLAVSNYSQEQDAAIELVKFLSSPEVQKKRAIENSKLPTIASIYDDPEVQEKAPLVATWKDVVLNAVPRPSAPTKSDYNEVSKEFWDAAHATLSGGGNAEQQLDKLEKRLKRLRGRGW